MQSLTHLSDQYHLPNLPPMLKKCIKTHLFVLLRSFWFGFNVVMFNLTQKRLIKRNFTDTC